MSAAEHPAIAICPAAEPGEIAHVRRLLLLYQASLSVDLCFQDFAAELEGLPGAYAPPRGSLLLAWRGDSPAGCVALRPLATEGDAEMKRLYIVPEARGQAVGRRLVEAVIAQAAGQGYRRLLLDTLPEMAAAQRLYRQLGFAETGPYVHNPVSGSKFFALTLV